MKGFWQAAVVGPLALTGTGRSGSYANGTRADCRASSARAPKKAALAAPSLNRS